MKIQKATLLCRWFDNSLNWLFLLSCGMAYIAAPTTEKMYGWSASATQRSMLWLMLIAGGRLIINRFILRDQNNWNIAWIFFTAPFFAFELYSATMAIHGLLITSRFDGNDAFLTMLVLCLNLPSCFLLWQVTLAAVKKNCRLE